MNTRNAANLAVMLGRFGACSPEKIFKDGAFWRIFAKSLSPKKIPIYKKNIIPCKSFNHPRYFKDSTIMKKPQPLQATLEKFSISPKILNPPGQARQTRPNSGGVAEGQPRFDKGGCNIFYFLRVKNITF